MYNLFAKTSTNRAASFAYPMYDYIRRTMMTDIEKLIQYRRRNTKAVKSDHILVRTIGSLNVPYEGNLEVYRGMVEARTAQFAGGLGYTTDLYKGKPFFGRNAGFYGNKTVEILIATEDDFDIKNARTDWMTWRPIRVVSHPRSDITIEVLDGTNKFTESGLCVIEVNIPMLACQYQMWKETYKYNLNNQGMPTVSHFITAFPLTNAIYSHLDVAIFNRMYRLLCKEKMGTAERSVPFYTTDLTRQIDSFAADCISRMLKQQMTWEDILRNIPSLIDENMLVVHQLPKMPRNAQDIWALTAARLNVVAFLVKLRDKGKHYTSVDEVTALRRSLITLDSGKLLSNGISPTIAKYFETFITNRIENYL